MTTRDANELILRICTVLDINVHLLKSKSRKANVILARRAFMKLLTDTGMTTKHVGKLFGQSHSNVICQNRKHKDLFDIKDKMYIRVFEKIKKEFILRAETVDNAIHSLLEIVMNENKLRHDNLMETTRENRTLKEEIECLKQQLNILTK